MRSIVGVLAIAGVAYAQSQCAVQEREYGLVCICNETYCDEIALHELDKISLDTAVVFTSNEAGLRMEPSIVKAGVAPNTSTTAVRIVPGKDTGDTQIMIGFGGAFTDAAAYVLSTVSEKTRAQVVKSYFSRTSGARYSLGRVHIGSADFSRASYSLMENVGAPFKLTDDRGIPGEDYKLDFIKSALAEITRSNNESNAWADLQIFASVWSAPPWWKTCETPPNPFGINVCGDSWLARLLKRPQVPTYFFGGLDTDLTARDAYAAYLVNFIRSYTESGVKMWGITAQNEPSGNPVGNSFENTNYSPLELARFINENLGPAMRKAYPNLRIMTGDDQYVSIMDHADLAASSMFIDGVAYHWYGSLETRLEDTPVIPGVEAYVGGSSLVAKASRGYDMKNRKGSPKFLLATEACNGYMDNTVYAGSWARGYAYLRDIMHQVNNGASGWTDWNLALDMQGGPNHANNFVDAPILVDAAKNEIVKQPMYYAMAHFSAFVPPGSTRINVRGSRKSCIGAGCALEVTAFQVEDGRCVVVVANDRLALSVPLRTSPMRSRLVQITTFDGRVFALEIGQREWKTVVYVCDAETEQVSYTIFDESHEHESETSSAKESATIEMMAIM